MPSFPAFIRIAVYWFVWLLVVGRLLQGYSAGSMVSTLAWIGGTTAIAAWFTWIKIHDDKRGQMYGEDAVSDDGPASPATRFTGAFFLGLGVFVCLALAAMLPPVRGALFVLALVLLVAAVVVLLFGRKSTEYDVDL